MPTTRRGMSVTTSLLRRCVRSRCRHHSLPAPPNRQSRRRPILPSLRERPMERTPSRYGPFDPAVPAGASHADTGGGRPLRTSSRGVAAARRRWTGAGRRTLRCARLQPGVTDRKVCGVSSQRRRVRCWCERGDSNPHGLPHWHLKPARLPIPPLSRLPEAVQYIVGDVAGAPVRDRPRGPVRPTGMRATRARALSSIPSRRPGPAGDASNRPDAVRLS